MKRRELLRLFEKVGWRLERHGGNHDIYTDGVHVVSIPRHPNINEQLAKALIKRWGLR